MQKRKIGRGGKTQPATHDSRTQNLKRGKVEIRLKTSLQIFQERQERKK